MADPNTDPEISGGDVTATEPDISGGDATPGGSPLVRAYHAVGEGYQAPFQNNAQMVEDVVDAVGKHHGIRDLLAKYPPKHQGVIGTLKDALTPLNPVVVKRDESGEVDYPSTAGATIGNIGALLTMGKALGPEGEPKPDNATRSKALTRAVGIGKEKSIDFPAEFRAALPELDQTVQQSGINPAKATPQDLSKVVKDTFSRTESTFNSYLGRVANQQVMPTSIVTELNQYKVANPVTPRDIAWNKAIDDASVHFQKPLTYGQINEQRMLARDRIADFGKLNPSTQGNKMGSQIDMAIDNAIHDGTKNIIYDKLQSTYASQVPPNYFRDLKRTQSALYNITDQLKGRLNSLSNQDAQSFLDRLRPHAYFSGTGHVGGAVGGISEALFPESKAAASNVRKGLTPAKPPVMSLPQLLISPLANVAPESKE